MLAFTDPFRLHAVVIYGILIIVAINCPLSEALGEVSKPSNMQTGHKVKKLVLYR